MPILDRNGVAINYAVHGSGPAILLTHGFSATQHMWDGNIAALSQDHSVITWDMRGHGQSAAPAEDGAYGEDQTLADMLGLLDHLGIDQAIVGGLSLGGYMSLSFHAHHPERVAALLVIDTGPGYRKDESRNAWNAEAMATGKRIETDGAAALSGASQERTGAVHRDIQGLAHAARRMLTQRDATVINNLPNIRVPTLLLVGAEDHPYIMPTAYMAGKVPGAEHVVVPNAGHAVNMDQPEAFNTAVCGFLQRHQL